MLTQSIRQRNKHGQFLPVPIAERFWPKVSISPTGCWNWTAGLGKDGYGLFWRDGRTEPAHRVSYELLKGPIPEGLTLDHLCRNPPCVNTAHLEAVTIGDNVRRGTNAAAVNAIKTKCIRDHSFTEANTYVTPGGRRQCRVCNGIRHRRWLPRH